MLYLLKFLLLFLQTSSLTMDEFVKLITSVQGQAFAVPAISVAVGIVLRVSSRSDKYSPPGKEDYAVGFDLFLASVTFLIIKIIDLLRLLITSVDSATKDSLFAAVVIAVLLLASFFIVLQMVLLVVRKRGWDANGQMTNTGLWAPIAFGLTTLWLAVILVSR